MRPVLAIAAIACLPIAACSAEPQAVSKSDHSTAADVSSGENGDPIASATLRLPDNSEIGTAVLSSSEDGLQLEIALKGLEAGDRAIHLHTTGLCEAPEFKSAGGHLNPGGNSHGSLSDRGRHLGDLPNISVGNGGSLSQKIALHWAEPNSLNAIFDEDGTAVMIHEGPDDYLTDPSGDAGSRIACGVLRR